MRSSPPECMLCLVEITSREVNEARRPHTSSKPCVFEEKKENKNEIPPHPKHTHLKMRVFSSENSLWTCELLCTPKAICLDMAIVQPTEQPRTSPPGSRWSEHMPRHVSCVRLPEGSVSRARAIGAARCVPKEIEN